MMSELGSHLYSRECADMWLGAAYVLETLESEIFFQKGELLPKFFAVDRLFVSLLEPYNDVINTLRTT